MGEIRVSLPNFFTVGLMAFIFIYAVNRGIKASKFAAWAV
jgi:hypothetical protein